MEKITLGEIAFALAFLVGLIGSIKYLLNDLKRGIKKEVREEIQPIKQELKELKENNETNRLNSLKTDLVNLMSLADKGMITPEQKINAHELYDEYKKKGGNSYIHDWWERLKKEGKI